MARHTAKSHKIRKVEILVIQIRILLFTIFILNYDIYYVQYLFLIDIYNKKVQNAFSRSVPFEFYKYVYLKQKYFI